CCRSARSLMSSVRKSRAYISSWPSEARNRPLSSPTPGHGNASLAFISHPRSRAQSIVGGAFAARVPVGLKSVLNTLQQFQRAERLHYISGGAKLQGPLLIAIL